MQTQYNTPDLNSVLRTLSVFSNQPNNNNQPTQQQQQHSTHHENDDNDPYEPPDALPHPQQPITQAHPRPHHHQQPNHPSISTSRQPQNVVEDKDPSTITAWPPALKQVMRTVSQNEDIQRRIRFLIQRQHDHEKQWFAGRESLLRKQNARAEKKRELDEVLRSVGAPVDEKEVSTAEEDTAELQNYDAKVYRASKKMAEAMLLELRALRIPFFCLRGSLIAEGPADATAGSSERPPSPGGSEKQSTISAAELATLQRRVLELLQDLCRD